jgi:hypothetical protein
MNRAKVLPGCFALVVLLSVAWRAQAQNAKAPYPSMAPLNEYLMVDRNAEIALARSAAPDSISRNAEVMVLGSVVMRRRSREKTDLYVLWTGRGCSPSTNPTFGTRKCDCRPA